ncbi:MAG: hypothetical protein ACI9V1_001223 [Spirosomataceae bacterium]|jgi:hypothetical protein
MSTRNIYLGVFAGILAVEVCIALFVRDAFIRPYFGDFLATILVYVAIRGFTNLNIHKSLIISLVISYVVEIFQAIDVLGFTGLNSNEAVSVIMGSSFDWGDMLAYTIAGLSTYLCEQQINYSKM